MALINRVGRLVRADIHAVLDRIEEPEQLLRQALRDMEDELASAEQRAVAAAAEIETFAKRKSELVARCAELDGELDLCFARKKSELARTLVRRKLEAERLIARLDSRQKDGEAGLEQARADLEQRRHALEGLRQKAEVFATPVHEEGPQDEVAYMLRELSVSDDEIDVALLREQEKRSAS